MNEPRYHLCEQGVAEAIRFDGKTWAIHLEIEIQSIDSVLHDPQEIDIQINYCPWCGAQL